MKKSSGSGRGIGARLSRAFLLQATFISVAAVVGVFVAGALLERLLIREALRDEAAHFWEQRSARPDFPLPRSSKRNSNKPRTASPKTTRRTPDICRKSGPGWISF